MKKCKFAAFAVVAAVAMASAVVVSARAADVIGEWDNAKAPLPPEVKQVTVDAKTTALLLLDLLQQNCGRRPRCLAEIPAIKKLLDTARAAGATVVYSGFGKFPPSDIIKDVAPIANEPMIHSDANKFENTDLDKVLKDKGIKTVIVVGTGANGAVLTTASVAVEKDYNVIVPVDGISGNDIYSEQFTAWNLVNATPTFVKLVKLTRTDMIKF